MLFAQNPNTENLSFKGIPIDVTHGGYISKMRRSGFNRLGTAVLGEDFAGYKNCNIGVSTLYGDFSEADSSRIQVIFSLVCMKTSIFSTNSTTLPIENR